MSSRYLLTLLFFLFNFHILLAVNTQEIKNLFIQYKLAEENQSELPLIKQSNQMTLEDFYEVQKLWVDYKSKNFNTLGYFIELTEASDQKLYNINTPILGTLLEKESFNNFSILKVNQKQKKLGQIKIGYILNQSVNHSRNITHIKHFISDIIIIFSIAQKNSSVTNIKHKIATNTQKTTFIHSGPLELNSFQVTLLLDIKHKGYSYVSLDLDIVKYNNEILWLIKHLKKLDYPLKKGDLLVTDSLIPSIPINKGRYLVNAGQISSLIFQIQ